MATRIEKVDLVIPAGTPIAAPVSQQLFTTRGTVTRLDIRVPPGPWGTVGFSFWHSSEQIIPKIPGTWIITNDEMIQWPLNGYSDQPSWLVRGYNTDIYTHTIYVTTLIEDWQPGGPVVVAEETIPG
jgi:hypothetical protein